VTKVTRTDTGKVAQTGAGLLVMIAMVVINALLVVNAEPAMDPMMSRTKTTGETKKEKRRKNLPGWIHTFPATHPLLYLEGMDLAANWMVYKRSKRSKRTRNLKTRLPTCLPHSLHKALKKPRYQSCTQI